MTLLRSFPINDEEKYSTGDVARGFLADHMEKGRVGDFLLVEYKNRKISPETKNSFHTSPRQLQNHSSTQRIPSTFIPLLPSYFLPLIYQSTISYTMADTSKSGLTISLSILEKIPKLQDQEGYLKWKRAMRDHLKMFGLWVYIDELTEAPEDDDEEEEGTKAQDLTCTAIRICVEGNAYTHIEHITNANSAWKTLEENFKPRGSGFLNDTFRKLDNLKLGEFTSPSDYSSQFRQIVNDLQSFSSIMKLDENWLIYRFHTNLGAEFSSYFERYSQAHDPFNEHGEAKHSFSSAMQHFLNTARNLSSETHISKPSSGIISPHTSSVSFVASNLPANQTSIQAGAKPGTNQARVITLTKTVKYCTHCKRDYHIMINILPFETPSLSQQNRKQNDVEKTKSQISTLQIKQTDLSLFNPIEHHS